MFRAADIGRMWVPVVLPLGETEGDVKVDLLMTLYTRSELRDREASAMKRAAESIAARAAHVKTADDLQALMDDVAAIENDDASELLARTHDWRGVEDEVGQAQAFTRERLEALLAYKWFFRVHREALFDASRGGVAKNWKPGPGGLPARVQA